VSSYLLLKKSAVGCGGVRGRQLVALSVLSLIAAFWLMAVGHPEGAYLLALPLLTAAPRFIAALRGKSDDAD